MEINLKSWHGIIVRLTVSVTRKDYPMTICGYIGCILNGLFLAVFGCFITVSLVTGPFYWFLGNGYEREVIIQYNWFVQCILIMGLILWMFIAIVGIMYSVGCFGLYIEKLLSTFSKEYLSEERSNIFVEGYRSFKNKYCTMVTYKDDTQ